MIPEGMKSRKSYYSNSVISSKSGVMKRPKALGPTLNTYGSSKLLVKVPVQDRHGGLRF